MLGCCGMAERVPGGLGDSNPLGSILSFFPDTIKAASGIATAVPGIAAAFGEKNAKAFMNQQQSLECTKAGGIWNGETCDMALVYAQREAEAQRRASIDQIKAVAPWIGLGIGTLVLGFVATKKRSS